MTKRTSRPLNKQPVNPVWRPGRSAALKYLHHASQFVHSPNRKVVVYHRVSGGGQHNPGSFAWQRRMTKEYVKKRGFEVIDTFENVTCGRYFSHRPKLKKAIALARRHGAIVIAPTRDRFVRAIGYRGPHETDVPTRGQYEELLRLADGVPLATILPPGNSPDIVRSVQSHYGQVAARNKGGRPRKKPCSPGEMKARRLKELPLVEELYRQGWTYGEIAEEVGRARSTIQTWVNRHFAVLKAKRRGR